MERKPAPKVSRIRLSAEGAVEGVLYGDLPNKSNSRRIFRGRMIKAQDALDFVHKVQILGSSFRARGPLTGATSKNDIKADLRPLVLSAVVYGASWQRDLDVELLPDALQAAGVINNDRAIREKHYWWRHDPADPRVEFEVRIQEREA